MNTEEKNLFTDEEKFALRHIVLTRKTKKLLFFATLILAMVLVVTFFAVSNANLKKTINGLESQIKDLMEQPIVVNPIAPFIALDTIYEEIKGIGELATVAYLFTDAAIFTDSKQIGNWNIPFTQKSFTINGMDLLKQAFKSSRLIYTWTGIRQLSPSHFPHLKFCLTKSITKV